jgi:hypothetical protein
LSCTDLTLPGGALQAVIPFVAEALRCDMLRVALDGISKQFFTQVRHIPCI